MALQATQAQRARSTTQVCPGRLMHQLQHPACKHVYAVTLKYVIISGPASFEQAAPAQLQRGTPYARQFVGVWAHKGLVLS